MSKAHPPELKRYMDKKLSLKLNGGRNVAGILRGFDPFMNLVIDESIEERKDGSKVTIGMVADKEKKKKKKAKEEAAPEAAAPEPEPEAPAADSNRASSRGSKKAAKRSGSNVFSMFSQNQVAEFKEGFAMMDHDKDGIIGKNDLRATFNQLGRIVSEKELDEMVNESPGPINFTQLLQLFANRMSGGSDDDNVIIAAFKTFDTEGHIDSENLKHALMTWGDKFSEGEVDDAFENMQIDDKGNIDTQALINMLIGGSEEDEEA